MLPTILAGGTQEAPNARQVDNGSAAPARRNAWGVATAAGGRLSGRRAPGSGGRRTPSVKPRPPGDPHGDQPSHGRHLTLVITLDDETTVADEAPVDDDPIPDDVPAWLEPVSAGAPRAAANVWPGVPVSRAAAVPECRTPPTPHHGTTRPLRILTKPALPHHSVNDRMCLHVEGTATTSSDCSAAFHHVTRGDRITKSPNHGITRSRSDPPVAVVPHNPRAELMSISTGQLPRHQRGRHDPGPASPGQTVADGRASPDCAVLCCRAGAVDQLHEIIAWDHASRPRYACDWCCGVSSPLRSADAACSPPRATDIRHSVRRISVRDCQ